MSADSRIVVIKDAAGGAFAGVLTGSEFLVSGEKDQRVRSARYRMDDALSEEPPQKLLVVGLVRYTSFEDALGSIGRIRERWNQVQGPIEYDEPLFGPLILEWTGEDVRVMRPVAYA